jgi:hypothetical protein
MLRGTPPCTQSPCTSACNTNNTNNTNKTTNTANNTTHATRAHTHVRAGV